MNCGGPGRAAADRGDGHEYPLRDSSYGRLCTHLCNFAAQQHAASTAGAFRLCSSEIPNIPEITLRKNRENLSRALGPVFPKQPSLAVIRQYNERFINAAVPQIERICRSPETQRSTSRT
jgi:hypothetical protein